MLLVDLGEGLDGIIIQISWIRSCERERLRGPPSIKVLHFPRLAMSIIF